MTARRSASDDAIAWPPLLVAKRALAYTGVSRSTLYRVFRREGARTRVTGARGSDGTGVCSTPPPRPGQTPRQALPCTPGASQGPFQGDLTGGTR